MKNKLILHYVIAIAALLVVLFAAYRLYQNPALAKYLWLTIIGCAVVAVGQLLLIRQKRKLGK